MANMEALKVGLAALTDTELLRWVQDTTDPRVRELAKRLDIALGELDIALGELDERDGSLAAAQLEIRELEAQIRSLESEPEL